MDNQEDSPIISLVCSCCKDDTQGRQWWNRDTGYGICVECIKFLREVLKTPEETIANHYGREGFHWGINQEDKS